MSPALQNLNSQNPKPRPEHGEISRCKLFALSGQLQSNDAELVKNWSLCARCATCAPSSVAWIWGGLSFGMAVRMLPASRSSIDSPTKFDPCAFWPLSCPPPFKPYSFTVLSDFDLTTWSMACLAFDSFQFALAIEFLTLVSLQSVPATTTSVNKSQWLISQSCSPEW